MTHTYKCLLNVLQVHVGVASSGCSATSTDPISWRRWLLTITPLLLRVIKGIWDQDSDDPRPLWTACCLAFFGFTRASESIVLNYYQSYDPTIHLSLSDVTTQPILGYWEFDKRHHILSLLFGKLVSDICPMATILAYRGRRGWRDRRLL